MKKPRFVRPCDLVAWLITALATLGALALAATPAWAAAARPNPVLHWNGVAAEAHAPSQGTNPMAQSRTFAILHAAVHDAVNAIERRYAPYTPGLAAAAGASVDAAVAAAARDVLVTLLPEQAARVEAAYVAALGNLPDGPARVVYPFGTRQADWAHDLPLLIAGTTPDLP